MIREATLQDLGNVFNISKRLYLHSANHIRIYEWDDDTALDTLREFITSKHSTILIDEKDGDLRGFIMAQLTTPYAGISIIANDIAFFVSPEFQGGNTALRLIRAYEKWAKQAGATHIELGVSSGVDTERALSMYSYLGYAPSSVTYIKEL